MAHFLKNVTLHMGGRPGLVVMGGDFEHRILDGYLFKQICRIKLVFCLKKAENKSNRGRGWSIKNKLSKKTINKVHLKLLITWTRRNVTRFLLLLLLVLVVKLVDVQQVRIGRQSEPLVAHERYAHLLKVVQSVHGLD